MQDLDSLDRILQRITPDEPLPVGEWMALIHWRNCRLEDPESPHNDEIMRMIGNAIGSGMVATGVMQELLSTLSGYTQSEMARY